MAYDKDTITLIGSERTSFTKEWNLNVTPDTLVTYASNKMPKYARLTNVTNIVEWKTSLSSAADYRLYIAGAKIGSTCEAWNKYFRNEHSGIQNCFLSETANPYTPIGKIEVNLSATLMRTFYVRLWQIVYDYQIPVFVVSLSKSGEGTVSGAGTYDIGTNATITATPSKGYKFIKWNDGNTSASRTVTVANGEQTAFSTTLNYKAVFEMDTVLIAYYGNGATSGELGRVLEQKDISCTLETNWFEKKYAVQFQHNDGTETVETLYSSADFLGWYTSAEGGERVGGGGDSFTPTGTTELYAHWSDMSAVTLPTLTRDRYTFLGWYTAAEEGTKVGGGGDSFTPTGSTTLYAHWEEIIVPPEIVSVAITYGGAQVSAQNKIPAGEGYLIAVGIGYSNNA